MNKGNSFTKQEELNMNKGNSFTKLENTGITLGFVGLFVSIGITLFITVTFGVLWGLFSALTFIAITTLCKNIEKMSGKLSNYQGVIPTEYEISKNTKIYYSLLGVVCLLIGSTFVYSV